MVIEWIANNVKREYIEDFIAGINKGKTVGAKLRPLDVFNFADYVQVEGFEEFVRELEYDNVYVRFLASTNFDGKNMRPVAQCFVFCFGDVGCDVHKLSYAVPDFQNLPPKMFEDLKKNEYMFTYQSEVPNVRYIKKYILPNMMPQQKLSYLNMIRKALSEHRQDLPKNQDREWKNLFEK